MKTLSRVLLAVMIVSPAAVAQTKQTSLELHVACEPCVTSLDGQVKIYVSILNLGPEPQRLFGRLFWGPIGGTELVVLNAARRPVRVDDHELPSPHLFRHSANYVELLPTYSFGVLRTERAGDIFPNRGEYEVFVRYASPVPAASVPKSLQDVWVRERPRLESKRIRITVQ
jgi:hypothetical protein